MHWDKLEEARKFEEQSRRNLINIISDLKDKKVLIVYAINAANGWKKVVVAGILKIVDGYVQVQPDLTGEQIIIPEIELIGKQIIVPFKDIELIAEI